MSEPIRVALGVDRLEAAHDGVLLKHGIGFTDVVKRPTARADELGAEEFTGGVRDLVTKLEMFRPRIACFHGMMGYRPFLRVYAPDAPKSDLGPQPIRLGVTELFVVPNPSPANAHASPAAQTVWYDRLAADIASRRYPKPHPGTGGWAAF